MYTTIQQHLWHNIVTFTSTHASNTMLKTEHTVLICMYAYITHMLQRKQMRTNVYVTESWKTSQKSHIHFCVLNNSVVYFLENGVAN